MKATIELYHSSLDNIFSAALRSQALTHRPRIRSITSPQVIMSSYWYCCKASIYIEILIDTNYCPGECKDGGHGFGTSACPSCFHPKCGYCTTEYNKYATSTVANNSQSQPIDAAAAGSSSTSTTAQHAFAHSHSLARSHLLTHSHPINTAIISSIIPYGEEAPADGGKQWRWVCHECGGDNSCTYSKRCTSGDCHHAYEGCSQCDVYYIET